MQDIVQSALENQEEEEERKEDLDLDGVGNPRIVIVGAGGAGNNTVNRLYNIGVDDIEAVAVNTDKQHLEMVEADTKVLIGETITSGLGAGGAPETGQRAAEMSQSTIEDAIGDADLVFVTAGMGGGTGTGAAPVVSRIAKEKGAIVVGMVSTPFEVEGERNERAQEGVERLRDEADSIIVLDNERLLDYVPNLPISKAFSVMDQIIAETVEGISHTITKPSLINLDYADMTAIMGQGGVSVMLVGETKEKNKTQKVVDDAMSHPLLDVDYRGASGGLIHITGGGDLTLEQAEGIANDIAEHVDDRANIIWGARIRDDYDGKVRVMAIMTGIEQDSRANPSSGLSGGTGRAAGGLGDSDDGLDIDVVK